MSFWFNKKSRLVQDIVNSVKDTPQAAAYGNLAGLSTVTQALEVCKSMGFRIPATRIDTMTGKRAFLQAWRARLAPHGPLTYEADGSPGRDESMDVTKATVSLVIQAIDRELETLETSSNEDT